MASFSHYASFSQSNCRFVSTVYLLGSNTKTCNANNVTMQIKDTLYLITLFYYMATIVRPL